MQTVAILDNIRSVHNVGSIFRTADALGVEKLYLCGTTPTPLDRFGRARKDLAKVALGAEASVAWEYREDTKDAVIALKKEGFQIIAIEQNKNSKNISEIKPKLAIALIVGNEVGGISNAVLSLCDIIGEIPMAGKKESLNVSVAFGIAAHQILK